MSNGLACLNIQYNFANFLPLLGFEVKNVFAKYQGSRFRIDGEIGENMRSWFNVTASIVMIVRIVIHYSFIFIHLEMRFSSQDE